MPPIIKTHNLSKILKVDNISHTLLAPCTLSIQAQDMVAIMGSSGSGKSTLLNILAGLDTASSGTYELGTHHMHALSAPKLAEVRSHMIGTIFQQYWLIGHLTVLENITLPLFYNNTPALESRISAMKLMKFLGIADHKDKLPKQLSGGQQQRVSIARALITKPTILLADEPTGALDRENSRLTMQLLQKINHEQRTTVVMVTHDKHMASYCTTRYNMSDLCGDTEHA